MEGERDYSTVRATRWVPLAKKTHKTMGDVSQRGGKFRREIGVPLSQSTLSIDMDAVRPQAYIPRP